MKVEESKDEQIIRLTKERDEWHDAWAKQRILTGEAYWNGYAQAQKVMQNFLNNFPYSTSNLTKG